MPSTDQQKASRFVLPVGAIEGKRMVHPKRYPKDMRTQDGKLVGLVFDGNIHSISGSYWFDSELNRTVAVHPEVMLESLHSIYEADYLLEEMGIR